MPYPFSSIQPWTICSVFSFEKSSIEASTPRSSRRISGFWPFQYFRVCFSSYSAGAVKKNDVRSQRSVMNVARSFMMPAARPATSSATSMPWSRRMGWNSAASSASLLWCMYWALNHLALSGWKRAPDFETRSSEKLSISSCIEKISCSVPGFQPSSASMLMNASGK